MQLFLVSPEKEIHLKKEMHYLSHEYNEDTFPKTGKKKKKSKNKKRTTLHKHGEMPRATVTGPHLCRAMTTD